MQTTSKVILSGGEKERWNDGKNECTMSKGEETLFETFSM